MTQDANSQGSNKPPADPATPTPATGDIRPHKPADDKEEVYFAGSPLLRGEVGRVLLFGLIGLALIAIPIAWAMLANTGGGPGWIWWVIFVPAGLVVMLVPQIILKTIRYRISNYRIDFERGLLSKSIDTLELWHVDDISFHQSLIDRILGVGTIEIISNDDTTPKLMLRGLPSPRPVFESLKQRIISVKRQRGVIKMDVG